MARLDAARAEQERVFEALGRPARADRRPGRARSAHASGPDVRKGGINEDGMRSLRASSGRQSREGRVEEGTREFSRG